MAHDYGETLRLGLQVPGCTRFLSAQWKLSLRMFYDEVHAAIRQIDSWLDLPRDEVDWQQVGEDCREMLAEIEQKALLAGVPDAVRACQVAGGHVSLADCRVALATCLAAARSIDGQSIKRAPNGSDPRGSKSEVAGEQTKSNKRSPAIEYPRWQDFSLLVDVGRFVFFVVPVTAVSKEEACLKEGVQLEIKREQAQMTGLLMALAKSDMGISVCSREHAYRAMKFRGKCIWKNSKKKAADKLRQAVNDLSRKFKKTCVASSSEDKGPFSYNADEDTVSADFPVFEIEYLHGETALLVNE